MRLESTQKQLNHVAFQLESDIEAGKLDFLAQEAMEDFENGFCKQI